MIGFNARIVSVAGFLAVLGLSPMAAAQNKVFYGGNGTVPVDSGLPRVGEMYLIRGNGDLAWYRYGGNGQLDTRGNVPPWHPNSGNPIGNGWGDARTVMGCGDGTILAIQPNGDLAWYQYLGQGEANRSASTGWAANSGNPIGNGWQDFHAVFCNPREGRHNQIEIYAIMRNGDLRWYRYAGDGTADRAGSRGWHPNSGNVIGNGWQSVRQVFTAAGAIFAVDQDGQLRWYQYTGEGAPDRSGSQGWSPNSGNVIGNGWQQFRTVFGGSNDSGGFAAVIYAVKPDGGLYWYRYTGQGAADPSGNLNWAPNSGNQIGSGW